MSRRVLERKTERMSGVKKRAKSRVISLFLSWLPRGTNKMAGFPAKRTSCCMEADLEISGGFFQQAVENLLLRMQTISPLS